MSPDSGPVIAIDGPAGSGKSTVGKVLAAKLGFTYVDTGAMYRAITWKALQEKLDPADEKTLSELAEGSKIKFEYNAGGVGQRVILDGRDVTEEIRSLEVTKNVSAVSSLSGVRKALVSKQRRLVHDIHHGAVVEGRDIGSVVFKDASIKIFLDASSEERARRRQEDLEKAGIGIGITTVKQAMKTRDDYDSSREHSPLLKAQDAYVIDTTDLSIEQVVDRIITLYAKVKREI